MIAISYAMGPTRPWIDRGIEYPVLLGLVALYMMLRGGGGYSLDSRMKHEV
jgi:putative oxidoreductase